MQMLPKKLSPGFLGFLQSTGLFIYILFVTTFMGYLSTRFRTTPDNFLAPILMLLLFVFSAVISALIVLGKSGVLFWEKKYKESFTLLGWTIGWGIFYLVLVIFLLLKQ